MHRYDLVSGKRWRPEVMVFIATGRLCSPPKSAPPPPKNMP